MVDRKPPPPPPRIPHEDEHSDERTAEFSVAELFSSRPGSVKGAVKKVPALTAVAGRALGKVYRIDQPSVTLGRADDAEVSIHDDGVSRRHARITANGTTFTLEDLGSTNGTYVNGTRIEGPRKLVEGDDISIGGATILRYAMRDHLEEQLQAKLYDLATRDPLTQAFNRRHFEERLASEWAWSARHTLPCAVCSIDADHFKRINDGWGHAAGDYVLSELANVVRTIIRKEDVFARLGGEEFVVLARGTTLEAAVVLAERLRTAIEQHPFLYEDQRLPVTVSIGVATSKEENVSSHVDLMARADAALYRAKKAGRNRVCIL